MFFGDKTEFLSLEKVASTGQVYFMFGWFGVCFPMMNSRKQRSRALRQGATLLGCSPRTTPAEHIPHFITFCWKKWISPPATQEAEPSSCLGPAWASHFPGPKRHTWKSLRNRPTTIHSWFRPKNENPRKRKKRQFIDLARTGAVWRDRVVRRAPGARALRCTACAWRMDGRSKLQEDCLVG